MRSAGYAQAGMLNPVYGLAHACVAAGVDPGIIPERFLIGAAGVGLDQYLARPGVITKNFYKELVRR